MVRSSACSSLIAPPPPHPPHLLPLFCPLRPLAAARHLASKKQEEARLAQLHQFLANIELVGGKAEEARMQKEQFEMLKRQKEELARTVPEDMAGDVAELQADIGEQLGHINEVRDAFMQPLGEAGAVEANNAELDALMGAHAAPAGAAHDAELDALMRGGQQPALAGASAMAPQQAMQQAMQQNTCVAEGIGLPCCLSRPSPHPLSSHTPPLPPPLFPQPFLTAPGRAFTQQLMQLQQQVQALGFASPAQAGQQGMFLMQQAAQLQQQLMAAAPVFAQANCAPQHQMLQQQAMQLNMGIMQAQQQAMMGGQQQPAMGMGGMGMGGMAPMGMAGMGMGAMPMQMPAHVPDVPAAAVQPAKAPIAVPMLAGAGGAGGAAGGAAGGGKTANYGDI